MNAYFEDADLVRVDEVREAGDSAFDAWLSPASRLPHALTWAHDVCEDVVRDVAAY